MSRASRARSITTALTLTITTAAVALGAVLAQMPDTARPADTTVQTANAQETSTERGCWFEKAASLDTAELICGDVALAPADAVGWYALGKAEVPSSVWRYAKEHGAPPARSACECLAVPVGTAFGPDGEMWVATEEGMEPADWT